MLLTPKLSIRPVFSTSGQDAQPKFDLMICQPDSGHWELCFTNGLGLACQTRRGLCQVNLVRDCQTKDSFTDAQSEVFFANDQLIGGFPQVQHTLHASYDFS
jgi:hypothetical protein